MIAIATNAINANEHIERYTGSVEIHEISSGVDNINQMEEQVKERTASQKRLGDNRCETHNSHQYWSDGLNCLKQLVAYFGPVCSGQWDYSGPSLYTMTILRNIKIYIKNCLYVALRDLTLYNSIAQEVNSIDSAGNDDAVKYVTLHIVLKIMHQ